MLTKALTVKQRKLLWQRHQQVQHDGTLCRKTLHSYKYIIINYVMSTDGSVVKYLHLKNKVSLIIQRWLYQVTLKLTHCGEATVISRFVYLTKVTVEALKVNDAFDT